MSAATYSPLSKYRLSRRGRKLQVTDDQRTLMALPKDVPERTWAEVLLKEDTDQLISEIREDIVQEALKICYESYMEKQNARFTAHCAAQAWLKLIDWHFYLHDPGEDPTAYPPCYIPKRAESWIPDEPPEPSPKDTWCRVDLNVVENVSDEGIQRPTYSSSVDIPVLEEIPSEFWFPGKVNVPEHMRRKTVVPVMAVRSVTESVSGSSNSTTSSEVLGTESEVLQKVTDYSTEETTQKESSYSALKSTTPVDASIRGAGDSTVDRLRTKRRSTSDKSKLFIKSLSKTRGTLPPLDADSRSRLSIISDCRLRSLRLDTQYEISSEKVDSPPGEAVKRNKR